MVNWLILSSLFGVLRSIPTASAHYRFATLIAPNVTTKNAVRQPVSWNPMVDLASNNMRCNINAGVAKEVVELQAGTDLAFGLDNSIFHPGPGALYLGKVPESESAATWDGSGQNWFKIKNWGGYPSNWNWVFPDILNVWQVNGTIPLAVPSGEYLLRMEHIALNQGIGQKETQYYVSCAQVRIVGGGNGTPAPLVTIPGHFQPNDPGLQIDVFHPVLGTVYRVRFMVGCLALLGSLKTFRRSQGQMSGRDS
ncbi:hypothetical protein FA13DRAFT_1691419 [Coprinellus micaceus]|uniref:lytic cellulose monooxygenase (C4-dehydrogenating) n=1 Tax=Coprinellus micaceus TaxID=71717 RepID=A0A4Y7T0G5_COPMI|nr:hypothetical protein FA13DRAFT_1691419 [Coprinellus micaceus]